MATQTKTWQRKILEQAKATGYRDLFWYIEFSWWQAGQRHAPACHPGPWVPVVPVGPDPQASRNIADMLAHLFALSNEKRLTFAAALTSTEALAQTSCRHYLTFGASLKKVTNLLKIHVHRPKCSERQQTYDHGRFYHRSVLSGG